MGLLRKISLMMQRTVGNDTEINIFVLKYGPAGPDVRLSAFCNVSQTELNCVSTLCSH